MWICMRLAALEAALSVPADVSLSMCALETASIVWIPQACNQWSRSAQGHMLHTCACCNADVSLQVWLAGRVNKRHIA